MNKQDGTFSEEAAARGVEGGSPIGFATWTFDFDNDGDLDIFAANFAIASGLFSGGFGDFPPEHFERAVPSKGNFVPSAVYRNDGTGHFTNDADALGLTPVSVMGAQFLDFDLDGDLDPVLGPGSHPLKNMQPLLVYRNDGGERFVNVTPLSDPRYYGKFHGMAVVDHDRDGDPDLYVNNGGVMLSDHWRDLFLVNTTRGRHWLHLRLIGTTSNRSAIGARVTVTWGGGRKLAQEVAAGQGFGATNSPYLMFGLGDATEVESVSIRWPSGTTQALPVLSADQALVVTEGSDKLRRVY